MRLEFSAAFSRETLSAFSGQASGDAAVRAIYLAIYLDRPRADQGSWLQDYFGELQRGLAHACGAVDRAVICLQAALLHFRHEHATIANETERPAG
jgi:hypothetical protein